MKLVILFTIIIHLAWETCGLKILGVFPFPAPSHYILGSSLMRGLAEKGHDVTVINPFGEKDIPKGWKYRDIILESFAEAHKKQNINMFDFKNIPLPVIIVFFGRMGNNFTELLYNEPAMKKFLASGETFDVVIVEQFLSDSLKVLAYHFKANLILFSTIGANAWVNPLVGNPAPPSYIPESLTSYGSHMCFTERLFNSLLNVFGELHRNLLFFPQQNAIMKKYFPDAPDLSILNYNASLVLLNSHPAINQPVPLLPNMIQIGGFHVKPAKSLPKDLQEFLDKARNGVIYFSMGSNLKSKDLPIEKRDAILRVFSKLKQQVIWKWEDDVLPGQPANVKLGKWLPQQSILAHPNVKAFITHGGLLSTIETIYHGVPILAIPIFGDQEINSAAAISNGYGIKVAYADLTEESFGKTLNELLNNPKYRENARKRSKLLHDRPIKPMDEAAYWVEYVARHHGAQHFRSSSLDLAWYQYLLLDVIAVILVTFSITLFLIIKLIKFCCCRPKNRNQAKLKKN